MPSAPPLAGPAAALAAALALGCAAFTPARPKWPRLPEGHFMSVGSLIQVSGTAKADAKLASASQRRSESRDRALQDAWLRLDGYIKGLPTPDDRTVGEACRADPALQDKLDALLYSLLPVSTHWDEEDTAAVVIRVDRARIASTFGLVLR